MLIMRKSLCLMLLSMGLLFDLSAFAQQRQISGIIMAEDGNRPLQGVTVQNRQTNQRTQTNSVGSYTIAAQPGQQLVFTFVGYVAHTVTIGADQSNISFLLQPEERQMDQVVVTALGINRSKRSLGYAASDVKGADLAQTQRDNFINGLAGRVPGVTISGTSGMPGSSTSVQLRGVNSLSGSNQPLFGIDAANGAIVITTKKGKAGRGSLSYSYNYGIEKVGNLPDVPHVYNRGNNGILNLNALSTVTNNFFRQGSVQKHNLSFEGGSTGYTYRLSGSYSTREGVVPSTRYDRLNISLSGTAQLFKNFRAETNLQYISTKNKKVSKGANSFYLSLLSYPADVDMTNYLNATGSRSKLTTATTEIENPLFDVNKNQLDDKGNRVISNLSFVYDPLAWLSLTGRVGIDVAGNEYRILYHPEANPRGYFGNTNGSIDLSNQTNRIITVTYFAQLKKNFMDNKFRTTLRVGSAVYDYDDRTFASRGENFLDPNFNSVNNTTNTTQRNKSVFAKKRVVGAFGDFNVNYNNVVYVTATGRNDWTSTLPPKNNSFFYPSVSTSIVFSELLKNLSIINFLTMGRLRASLAQVGKDANPYATNPALEAQGTTGGGYSYGFTAPNPFLRPEKVTSKEIGLELQFFKNRLSLDAAYYKSKSVDQIINGLRISYGTGFILKNVNGGELENWGTELLLRGTPIQSKNFTWDASVNFTKTDSKLTRMPEGVSEYYNSDTWLLGNVRNGARLGGSLTTLTAIRQYQYNNAGQLLINPTSGLPVTSDATTAWFVAGDRNPDFKMGISNSFTYKGLNLNFLFDIKKGGDVFNGTGLYLYNLGLHQRSITDRETPLTFNGVLRDGLENTSNPTKNNITIIPYYNNSFYSGSIIDQEFIERDVNWVRLRDITLTYQLPAAWLIKNKLFKSASIGVTATDLYMWTNYTGGDPGVNGTTVATGGSGSMGIDYGNLPIPKNFNFNVRIGL